MIFVGRQTVEKAYEHRSKAFFLFVDLRKAYDSVSRECLWLVLEKAGVPPHLLSIIQSFHESPSASVCVGGEDLNPFLVRNCLSMPLTEQHSLLQPVLPQPVSTSTHKSTTPTSITPIIAADVEAAALEPEKN